MKEFLVFAKANPQAIIKVNDGNIPDGYTDIKPPEEKNGYERVFKSGDWVYEKIIIPEINTEENII